MGEADIERVRWPSVSMAASHLMGEAGTRRAIVDSLCADPLFTPDAFGSEPDELDPFDYEQAATYGTSAHPNQIAFHLRRAETVGYEALVYQSRRAGISVRFDASTARAHWSALFALGDVLAAAVLPDFGTAHLLSEAGKLFPTTDPDVAIRRLMDAGRNTEPAGYFADGAGGLGLRTYLGPLALDQLGRDRVGSLPAPAVVTDLDWGGMRVDLAAEPWAHLGPVTRRSWRRCMAHLAPAGWFATMTLHNKGQVTLTPPATPGWTPGGQVRHI